MDRVSLTIIVTGFVLMLGCTTLIAYQNVRLGQIQQHVIELIVQTHRQ
jgi:hypothetical protein